MIQHMILRKLMKNHFKIWEDLQARPLKVAFDGFVIENRMTRYSGEYPTADFNTAITLGIFKAAHVDVVVNDVHGYTTPGRSVEEKLELYDKIIEEDITGKYRYEGQGAGDDSMIVTPNNGIQEKMTDYIKQCSGMGLKTEHLGTLNGASFCRLDFHELLVGGHSAFSRPGHVLKKIGIKPDPNIMVCSKVSYDYLKARIYSACAQNYGLRICEVLLQFLLP